MTGLDWDRGKRTRPPKHGRLRVRPQKPLATREQLETLKALWRERGARPSRQVHGLTKAQANRLIREMQL